MDMEVEKVYVAVGKDLQDGCKTLEWTLNKWSSQQISIVILHVTDSSKDLVHSCFGKIPASALNDESLEAFRMIEQKETDKLLSKYIAFCGKVKAEILKVKKKDDPIHKLIVDLISELRITKLVMAITFMKSSSWRSKDASSGLFEVHKHKSDFCEFYIICGGKLVLLRGENDEGDLEDDTGIIIMREKGKSKKSWLGKIFAKTFLKNFYRSSASTNMNFPDSQNENLLSLNLDEENFEEDNDVLETSPTESDVPEHVDYMTNDSYPSDLPSVLPSLGNVDVYTNSHPNIELALRFPEIEHIEDINEDNSNHGINESGDGSTPEDSNEMMNQRANRQIIASLVPNSLEPSDNELASPLLPEFAHIAIDIEDEGTNQSGDGSTAKFLSWVFVITNFVVELLSIVFDQLSSKHKPQYGLIAMLMSIIAMLLCIVELIYKVQKEGVTWRSRNKIPWFYYPSPNDTRFGTFAEILGMGCAIPQFIISTVNYSFYHRHADSPINISTWPMIFAFVLLCSKFLENPNRRTT